MDIGNIKKFINYGNKVTSDTIFGFFVFEYAMAMIILSLSYNLKNSIICLIPIIIISTIFSVIYLSLGQNKHTQKNIFLFMGIVGMLCSFTCQIGCFLIRSLNIKKKILLLLLLLIVNCFIYIIIIIITKMMIYYAEKLSTAKKVSALITAPVTVFGIIISSKITDGYKDNLLIFAFAFFSFIFSFFFIYFIKYYYIIKLKRQENTGNGTGNDKKTGDGSLC